MTAPRSAGILLHRAIDGCTEVLLVHPGGPFWKNKDAGVWQIPKGLIEPDEDPEAAARREVAEELGCQIDGALVALGEIRQTGGKTVVAFAADHDFDPETLVSNMIEIEWPPRSGRRLTIPEVDQAQWFTFEAAGDYILPSQAQLLDRLRASLLIENPISN